MYITYMLHMYMFICVFRHSIARYKLYLAFSISGSTLGFRSPAEPPRGFLPGSARCLGGCVRPS